MKTSKAAHIANYVKKNNEIMVIIKNSFNKVVDEIAGELGNSVVKQDGNIKSNSLSLIINSQIVAQITIPMVVNEINSDIYQASEELITNIVYDLIEDQIKLR